jgi:hypothetical protein
LQRTRLGHQGGRTDDSNDARCAEAALCDGALWRAATGDTGARARVQETPGDSLPPREASSDLLDSRRAARWRIVGSGRARVYSGGGAGHRMLGFGKRALRWRRSLSRLRGDTLACAPCRGRRVQGGAAQSDSSRVRCNQGSRWGMTSGPHLAAAVGGGRERAGLAAAVGPAGPSGLQRARAGNEKK